MVLDIKEKRNVKNEVYDLEKLITKKFPEAGIIFNKPIEEEVLRKIEVDLPFRLPEDYIQFLNNADGQPIDTRVFFPPGQLRFLSLEEAKELWEELASYHEDTFFDEFEDSGRVRAILYHQNRFPIAYYELGTQYLMLDFVPGPSGGVGQLIYNPSEATSVVLAKNTSIYFSKLLDATKDGFFSLTELDADSGGLILFQTRETGPKDYEILRMPP
jgi:cell wall assembly regulator SMI1